MKTIFLHTHESDDNEIDEFSVWVPLERIAYWAEGFCGTTLQLTNGETLDVIECLLHQRYDPSGVMLM